MSPSTKITLLSISLTVCLVFLIYFLYHSYLNVTNDGNLFVLIKNNYSVKYNEILSKFIFIIIVFMLLLLISGFVVLIAAEYEKNKDRKRKLRNQGSIILISTSVFFVVALGVYTFNFRIRSQKATMDDYVF